MNEPKRKLLEKAKHLININKGILPRRSINILKKGLQFAHEKNDFSDLIEFVPMLERKYHRIKAKFEKAEISFASL